MKKKFNIVTCIVLVLTLCFIMASCASHNTADYSLRSENGKHYIVFDDPSAYAPIPVAEGENSMMLAPSLKFSSMGEFRNTVKQGKLTEEQKKTIAQFKTDETGQILSCDFDNLYVPTLPSSVSASSVIWSGGPTYCFSVKASNGASGIFDYETQEQYNNTYQREYVNQFDKVTVTKTETLGDNKQVIYSTAASALSKSESMTVRYTIKVGKKTIIVDKWYLLSSTESGAVPSSSVPRSIELFYNEGNLWGYASLRNFTEDPTDEWLSQFGLKKF